mmetsp:Transcript_19757/g.46614  ORF Transcript_19757/g.46614 Transcript_19757/m.46614 type:complete len:313 (+) Transcript_19757:362-1300(+)
MRAPRPMRARGGSAPRTSSTTSPSSAPRRPRSARIKPPTLAPSVTMRRRDSVPNDASPASAVSTSAVQKSALATMTACDVWCSAHAPRASVPRAATAVLMAARTALRIAASTSPSHVSARPLRKPRLGSTCCAVSSGSTSPSAEQRARINPTSAPGSASSSSSSPLPSSSPAAARAGGASSAPPSARNASPAKTSRTTPSKHLCKCGCTARGSRARERSWRSSSSARKKKRGNARRFASRSSARLRRIPSRWRADSRIVSRMRPPLAQKRSRFGRAAAAIIVCRHTRSIAAKRRASAGIAVTMSAAAKRGCR